MGDYIDVRDKEFIWSRAQIKSISYGGDDLYQLEYPYPYPYKSGVINMSNTYMSNNDITTDITTDIVSTFSVHYVSWHEKYDETISFESNRLARFGFFTLNPELPVYRFDKIDNNIIARLMFPVKSESENENINENINGNIKGKGKVSYKQYKVYDEPVIATCEEYYNYENSKICD